MNRDLCFLMTTCDEDCRHFDRKLAEFTKLGYPFTVNFDHCSHETKQIFKRHPLYLGGHENDDPRRVFTEAHRQPALDIIVRQGFRWATYTDTDEVLDRRAPEMIPRLLELDVDEIICHRVELWGDGTQRRVDGPYGPPGEFCRRFYNLRTGIWKYKDADVHAPAWTPRGPDQPKREVTSRLSVIHYGLMSMDDILRKKNRWTTIYTRGLGRMPYAGFYDYLTTHEPSLVPFDYDAWEGYECLLHCAP